MNKQDIIKVNNLCVSYKIRDDEYKFLDDVCLNVEKKQIIGIVGESGCGKTTLGKCLMRIEKPAKIISGTIEYKENNLINCDKQVLQSIRGRYISLIPQNAMNSLDPLMKVGKQLVETYRLHYDVSYKEAKEIALSWMKRVKITDSERVFNQYPHQLSGGLKQRVLIAMAMICNPEVVVADEPTTSLDIENEQLILKLFIELSNDYKTSFIIISHNIKAMIDTCDMLYVMYCGKIIEYATPNELLNNPYHPYTKSLIKSYKSLTNKDEVLYYIQGAVPDIKHINKNCGFIDRCEECESKCINSENNMIEISKTHGVRCKKY